MNRAAESVRPKPPDDLDGEALLEWQRICAELQAAGRLDKIDRAIITLYAETWAVNRAATIAVNKHGAVIKYPNGIPAASPFYKVQRESAAQLRGLLTDL